MNIGLTGTPGTGKTTISKTLDCNLISINDYYPDISNGKDFEGNWLIDLEKLNEVIDVTQYSNTIIEGHVAHFLSSLDLVVVLRCHPDKLTERLALRDYSEEKIRENVEAEALNIISDEAFELYKEGKVFELDTTLSDLTKTIDLFNEIMNGNIKSNKRLDYSETIMSWY